MIYYITLLFGSIITVFTCFTNARLLKKLGFFILYMWLFSLSALRWNIGTDYKNYVKQYFDINNAGYWDPKIEPLYYLLVRFTKLSVDNVQLLFASISLITILAYWCYSKKQNMLLAIFCFYTVLYLPSYSLIRQALAVCIVIIASQYVIEGKNKKSIFMVFIAAGFHYSALLFIPFILLKKIKIKSLIGLSLLLALIFLTVYYNIPRIILNSSLLQSTKYGVYSNNIFSNPTELGTGLGVIIKALPAIIFIVIADLFGWTNKESKKDKVYFLLWVNYAYLTAIILSLSVQIFNRLSDFFMFVPVITLCEIYNLIKNKNNRFIIVGVIAMLLLINFILLIIKNPSSNLGGLGISPYQSIL